jgi:MFS family permease
MDQRQASSGADANRPLLPHRPESDATSDDEHHGPIPTGVTGRRWYVLAVYFAFGITNQMQYVTYANIIRQAEAYFDCSAFAVNMLAAVFAVVYVILVFPACEVYGRIGLRNGLAIGTAMNFTAGTLKVIAVLWLPQYWLLMTAQLFCAVGQVFFLSLPPLLAATWFPSAERAIATAVGTLSGFLGMALGFGLTPLFVNDSRQDQAAFLLLFAIQCALAGLVFAAVIVGVPVAPPLPPSHTAPAYKHAYKELMAAQAAEQSNLSGNDVQGSEREMEGKAGDADAAADDVEQHPHVFTHLWAERHNTSFVALVVVFGIAAGTLTAFSTVLAQILQPYGLTEGQAGTMTLIGIVFGSVMCVIVGGAIDKFRKYRAPLILLNVLLMFFSVAIFFVLQVDMSLSTRTAFCYALVTCIPGVLLPMLPVGMEFAVELTYPVPEMVSSSACMWSNSFVAIIATVAASMVLGNNPTQASGHYLIGGLIAVVATATILITFVVKENLRRLEAEEEHARDVANAVHDEPAI